MNWVLQNNKIIDLLNNSLVN